MTQYCVPRPTQFFFYFCNMSITLESIPQSPNFLGNKPEFRLRCANASGGTTARFGILLTNLFPVGKAITVTIGQQQLRFAKTSFVLDVNYGWVTTSELRDAIANNYYLADLITVEDAPASDTSASFYIVGRSVGQLGLAVTADTSTGISISGQDGTDPAAPLNYSAVVRFETSQGDTPWVRLSPSAGLVSISAEMLRSMVPAPTLPPVSEVLEPQPLPDLISARLRYAEAFGSSPLVQKLRTTPSVQFFPGALTEPFSEQLLPDWFDENPAIPLASDSHFVLRVIGEDSGASFSLPRQARRHLNLFSLNTAEDRTATYQVQMAVSAHLSSDERQTTTHTFTLANGVLYRLPISPAILGIAPDVRCYDLSLYNPNGTLAFSQTYFLNSRPTANHFLLQDRYGLLSAFTSVKVVRSASFEADQVSVNGRLLSDIAARTEAFSATLPPLSRSEASRLALAIGGQYAYILSNDQWQRIVIEPTSVVYRDADTNIYNVTFNFAFAKNQVSNIASVNTSQFSPAVVDNAILTDDGRVLTTEALEVLQYV